MPREWMAVVGTMRQRPHVQLGLSSISVPRLFGGMLMREHIRRFGQSILDTDVLPPRPSGSRSSWPCDHFLRVFLNLGRSGSRTPRPKLGRRVGARKITKGQDAS